MEPISLLAVASLAASFASFALAVVAILFGWFSFSKSSDMQVKAQDTLAKISERAEVIVEHTSKQSQQAWDYITKTVSEPSQEELEEARKEREKEIRQIVGEAIRDAAEEGKKAGADPEKIRELEQKLESIITETAEKTSEAEHIGRAIDIDRRLNMLKYEINEMANLRGMQTLDERPPSSDRRVYLSALFNHPGLGKEIDYLITSAEDSKIFGNLTDSGFIMLGDKLLAGTMRVTQERIRREGS